MMFGFGQTSNAQQNVCRLAHCKPFSPDNSISASFASIFNKDFLHGDFWTILLMAG